MKDIDILKYLPYAPGYDFPEDRYPDEDGEPLESAWHRSAMNLLIDVVVWLFTGRTDYYVGGNMFIYFSKGQLGGLFYRGPDFFYVSNVDGTKVRNSWKVPMENDRYPDVIIELMSKKTAKVDLTIKKDIYEQRFRTPEYYCCDPRKARLQGWRLIGTSYVAIEPNDRGWLWCEQLGAWLGLWEGTFQQQNALWPRFYDKDGNLLLTEAEAKNLEAATERCRAETERCRADAAKAEIEHLKALLAAKGVNLPNGNGTASKPEN